ncbi:tetratricopeptide repeat protein [Catellatospora bangladeshensis]|uniref:tetratricopeptide repeat protein n=1 Tax=Catellatospora bangladeshensis TaxID=310355 RepID=UPI003620AC3C
MALDEALSAFEEALALINGQQEPGFYGVILHDIGDVHKARGDADQAVVNYRQAVQYKQLDGARDPGDLVTTMLSLADSLIDGMKLPQARSALDDARDLLATHAPEMEQDRRAVRVHRLGQTYERLGDAGEQGAYDEALSAYRIALDLVERPTDPVSYATVLRDIGDVYQAQGRLSEAAVAYETAVECMRNQRGAERNLAALLLNLGRIRRHLGSARQMVRNDGQAEQTEDAASHVGPSGISEARDETQ